MDREPWVRVWHVGFVTPAAAAPILSRNPYACSSCLFSVSCSASPLRSLLRAHLHVHGVLGVHPKAVHDPHASGAGVQFCVELPRPHDLPPSSSAADLLATSVCSLVLIPKLYTILHCDPGCVLDGVSVWIELQRAYMICGDRPTLLPARVLAGAHSEAIHNLLLLAGQRLRWCVTLRGTSMSLWLPGPCCRGGMLVRVRWLAGARPVGLYDLVLLPWICLGQCTVLLRLQGIVAERGLFLSRLQNDLNLVWYLIGVLIRPSGSVALLFWMVLCVPEIAFDSVSMYSVVHLSFGLNLVIARVISRIIIRMSLKNLTSKFWSHAQGPSLKDGLRV